MTQNVPGTLTRAKNARINTSFCSGLVSNFDEITIHRNPVSFRRKKDIVSGIDEVDEKLEPFEKYNRTFSDRYNWQTDPRYIDNGKSGNIRILYEPIVRVELVRYDVDKTVTTSRITDEFPSAKMYSGYSLIH